jgi:hypothetical protein
MARSTKQRPSVFARLTNGIASLVPSPGAARTSLVVLFWIAVAGGLAFGAVRGTPHLRAFAESRAHQDPDTIRVTFLGTPGWVPQTVVDQLGTRVRAALVEPGEALSVLDVLALRRVHVDMAHCGWFERVEQVRRTAIDEITVTASFRTPFALVRSGNEDHLVDVDGRLLPLSYTGTATRPKLPLIIGVALPKPAEPGTPWIGADLRAGLNLAKVVRQKSWFTGGDVHAIDVARMNGPDAALEILTASGTRIVWGSDPNQRTLAEAPPERKLASLDALYRQFGRLDSGAGGVVDLRSDLVTVAPAEPTSSARQDDPSSVTVAAE